MMLEGTREQMNYDLDDYGSTSKVYILKDLIQKYMPSIEGRNLKVLDIGYGSESLAIFMASLGHDVTSIDCSEEVLKKSMKNSGEYRNIIKFKKMDAQSLHFKDNSFDLIVAKNLISSLDYPSMAYREWYRVLSPGGKIINFDIKDTITKYRPLSNIERPSWDVDTLLEIGFNKVKVKNNVKSQGLQADDSINYSESLMFMVVSEK
ncbi:class I SAM-dependent methyltransferase [Romboutsia weinsteinii]|uniref:Class I SAM-dependent methyltransferase n=1 Tax=Romboutsia weinsteinii TaxID=2020949 RepID=A0A371J3H0_9FIRM|nr:class I SAM-dependent methyltransferase [Romboutsia weinsteinii]RDY27218.1 class I SAM-dependent methyltransferase [Romboutsia weinsteinii]